MTVAYLYKAKYELKRYQHLGFLSNNGNILVDDKMTRTNSPKETKEKFTFYSDLPNLSLTNHVATMASITHNLHTLTSMHGGPVLSYYPQITVDSLFKSTP